MTTTDPFTDAARAEAERVHREAKYLAPARRGPLRASATTMIEQREALAVAEARLLAVREMHTPHEEQVVTEDCSIEECDHEDECPTVPFLVCTECWRVADEADTYFAERGVGHVAYPCPTIQALNSARAARRDEEKR